MYETGDGVAQDLNKAAYFFKLGGPGGQGDLLRVYARQAEQGDAVAQVNLAKLYESLPHYYKDEASANRNVAEAVAWYGKAAAQGNGEAALSLGLIYAGLKYGNRWPKDDSEAKKWLTTASDLGNQNAQVMLAQLYWREWGEPEKAFSLYEKVAEQGVNEAENALGLMYESGEGIPHDDDKAVEWYSRAVAHGSKPAKANLDALMESRSGDRNIDAKTERSDTATQPSSTSGETNGVEYLKSGNMVAGFDRSGHGAVLCSWQINYSIMLGLKICDPDRHRQLQDDLAKSEDAINDFIVQNSPTPVTKEQLEKRISDAESKFRAELQKAGGADKCTLGDMGPMVMSMEQVSSRARLKGVADLLSVPRPPVMNPCL